MEKPLFRTFRYIEAVDFYLLLVSIHAWFLSVFINKMDIKDSKVVIEPCEQKPQPLTKPNPVRRLRKPQRPPMEEPVVEAVITAPVVEAVITAPVVEAAPTRYMGRFVASEDEIHEIMDAYPDAEFEFLTSNNKGPKKAIVVRFNECFTSGRNPACEICYRLKAFLKARRIYLATNPQNPIESIQTYSRKIAEIALIFRRIRDYPLVGEALNARYLDYIEHPRGHRIPLSLADVMVVLNDAVRLFNISDRYIDEEFKESVMLEYETVNVNNHYVFGDNVVIG